MDDFLSKPYPERPIVLSPPPVDQKLQNFSDNFQGPFVSQRNQSVGYNLQQEFEALKADLDLDLSHDADDQGTGAGAAAHPAGGAGASTQSARAPAFNSYNVSSDSLMRESLLGKGLGSLAPARPQSVNDFALMGNAPFRAPQAQNFYSDMMAYTAWMEKLSPQEIVAMLDYWCGSLPFDVLLTLSSRLQHHLGQPQPQPLFKNYPSGSSYADFPENYSGGSFQEKFQENLYPDLAGDMEALSVEPAPLAQPKPKANHFKSHLFEKVPRPKSADPALHRKPHGADGARSPTSHLYEKTNFLQLAAASQSPHYTKHPEDMDLSASKLGALATINSRVALDSRKFGGVSGNASATSANGANGASGSNATAGNGYGFPGYAGGFRAAVYEESLNRVGNSSSVPVNSKYTKKNESPRPKTSAPPTPVSGSSMPTEIASADLLTNIPAWLKLLRLHKYTDCLKDIYWKELVELGDEDLEERGVKALGARRKLLKAFDAVKQAHP